jgi:hypothetical protein
MHLFGIMGTVDNLNQNKSTVRVKFNKEKEE